MSVLKSNDAGANILSYEIVNRLSMSMLKPNIIHAYMHINMAIELYDVGNQYYLSHGAYKVGKRAYILSFLALGTHYQSVDKVSSQLCRCILCIQATL